MKKTNTSIMSLLLIVAVLQGTFSCIRPDLSDCTDLGDNVRLSIKIDEKVVAELKSLHYGIENTHIYIFDKNKKYYSSINGGKYNEDSYEFYFNLPGDDYTFVVWTNEGNSYKTNLNQLSDKPTLDQLKLFLDHNGVLTENIPNLLHGINSEVTIVENRNNHVVVSLTLITNVINIKVKGLPQVSDKFSFTITDNNSLFNFNGSVAGKNDSFDHIRTTSLQNNELNTTIKTLNLDNDQHLPFLLKNNSSGEVLFSDNLIKMIQNAYGMSKTPNTRATVDFSTVHIFNIVLTYDTNMDCTVTINGWDYKHEKSDLE